LVALCICLCFICEPNIGPVVDNHKKGVVISCQAGKALFSKVMASLLIPLIISLAVKLSLGKICLKRGDIISGDDVSFLHKTEDLGLNRSFLTFSHNVMLNYFKDGESVSPGSSCVKVDIIGLSNRLKILKQKRSELHPVDQEVVQTELINRLDIVN
jgi:hypothetical protein